MNFAVTTPAYLPYRPPRIPTYLVILFVRPVGDDGFEQAGERLERTSLGRIGRMTNDRPPRAEATRQDSYAIDIQPWPSPMARFVALYGMLYCAFGSMSPFLPELMQYHGLSTIGIGTVVALGTATRLIAGPLIGRMADERRAWRGLLFICAGAAGFSAMLYLPVYGFWPLLLVSLLQAAVLAPLAPLADALAVSAAQKRHFEYGWVRGTGSAAFIAGLIIGGYAAGWLGSSAIVLCSAPLLVMAGVAALGVPDIAAGPPALTPLPVVGAIKLLLGEPIFRRLLLVAALILGSHALHDTFAVIRWRGAGIDRGIASLLWSTSVVSEVLMFFLLGPLLLHRLGPSRAAALAAAAGVLRWTVLGATSEVLALALVEPLHGFTFALLHLAAMQLIATTVPLSMAATAQAIYGTVAVGSATALMTFASGWLYDWLDSRAFWVMALLCAATIPIAFGLSPHPAQRHAVPASQTSGAAPLRTAGSPLTVAAGFTDIERPSVRIFVRSLHPKKRLNVDHVSGVHIANVAPNRS